MRQIKFLTCHLNMFLLSVTLHSMKCQTTRGSSWKLNEKKNMFFRLKHNTTKRKQFLGKQIFPEQHRSMCQGNTEFAEIFL